MRVPPPVDANGDWSPHAGELFTDREIESQAFKSALASFRRLIDQDDEVGTERRNIVTFHGLGGIGKTALSERLEAWVKHDLPLVNGWGPSPATKVDASVRMDLHGSAGRIDMTAVLLALRTGVAGIRRRWPLFDLAFAAYWSAVRPGEPLPNMHSRSEYADVVADTTGEVLKDLGSVADYVVGTPVGFGVWGIRKIIGVLRRRRDVRLGVDSFAGFESFLLRCADEPSPTESRPELACEIAATLSWELATMTPSPLVAVFIDTAERLALDPRRISEGHLNRLIHDMPNVLFVLTGRAMLDWYRENRVDLPYRGRWIWPGLVPDAQDAPRQYLVGNLSPSDTRELIQRGRRQLDLPMSDEVAEELARSSAGLPQYLELARQVAISIKTAGQGRLVQVTDVTGGLGSLVMRVLDGIPADEQRAIRAACLFRVFDTALIAAAADVDHGCAERAVARPMIDRHEGERFPYRMHDAVREAIRRTDHQVAGGWSERDWELAASRAAVAVRQMHDDAKQREDNSEVLDAIGIAIGLVCEQNTTLEPSPSASYADWLSRAIVFSPSVQGLRSRVPAVSRTAYGQHVLNFIAAKSLETPGEERLRLLREISGAEHPLRRVARRHLGYTLRAQHRWDEALAIFDELAAQAPTPLHLGQRPQILSTARRFMDAREAAEGLPVQALITRAQEYAHGRPERYFAEIEAKLAALRGAGRQREYLEEVGVYLQRRAFLHDDLGIDEINNLRDHAELAGHTVATRCALLATVLVHRSDPAEVSFVLDRLKSLDLVSGPAGEIGFRYAFAEFCDARLAGDWERLAVLQQEVDRIQVRTRPWVAVECFLESVGLPVRPAPTQWIEPYNVVRRRWAAHLRSYLTRYGVDDCGQPADS
ncbi:tetratricopeptide repeat protein [Micromonospora sp. NPDC048930]|uniref:tetratricopeptide repeat protein n=1 Tax=Micromonospora sp. NPDC048930 TaxID=3364261 RepID=UPI0037210CBF